MLLVRSCITSAWAKWTSQSRPWCGQYRIVQGLEMQQEVPSISSYIVRQQIKKRWCISSCRLSTSTLWTLLHWSWHRVELREKRKRKTRILGSKRLKRTTKPIFNDSKLRSSQVEVHNDIKLSCQRRVRDWNDLKLQKRFADTLSCYIWKECKDHRMWPTLPSPVGEDVYSLTPFPNKTAVHALESLFSFTHLVTNRRPSSINGRIKSCNDDTAYNNSNSVKPVALYITKSFSAY